MSLLEITNLTVALPPGGSASFRFLMTTVMLCSPLW